jgi:hypothetical protein
LILSLRGFDWMLCGDLHLQSLHYRATEHVVMHDGFPTDGFAPPPEMEYACGGGKMKPIRVMSVQIHLILIR